MKKTFKTLLALSTVILLSGCKTVTLSNGENAIVTFKDGGISSDEFYNELKTKYAENILVDYIDNYLLTPLYEEDSDFKKTVKSTIKDTKSQAEQYGIEYETYITYISNATTVDEYEALVKLNYRRQLWANDYAKKNVTDKEVNDYYEKVTIGDMELKHILITADITDDMSDSEQEEAKNTAKTKAKEVIEKLNNGEDFDSLVLEYSEDDATKNDNGLIGKVNVGDYDENIINYAKDMEVGTYSTEVVESTYGYHIIYKVSQDEKPELDDELIDEIKTTIGEETASDTSYVYKALKALREENEIEFEDSELESIYKDYLKNQNLDF